MFNDETIDHNIVINEGTLDRDTYECIEYKYMLSNIF
jgi:hypothetical protein